MELKAYLRVIARRWWMVLATVVLATLATLALVMPKPWIYESIGTMLIRPNTTSEGDAIDASDLLIRGVKIGSTYATVARSDLIRRQAEEGLDPALDTSELSVEAELLTDTNIISLSVRGTDPEAVQALAVAIQSEMASYVEAVDNTYVLEPLDEPKVPKSPIAPNKMLTVVLGMFLGLSAGVGLVFLERYLWGEEEETAVAAPAVDPRSGLYSGAYLGGRVQEEMSRAQRTGHGFSFIILRTVLGGGDTGEALRTPSKRQLRSVGNTLRVSSPPEAVVGYLDDGLFAALLPDSTGEEAEELLMAWEAAVGAAFSEHRGRAAASLRVSTGTCAYRDESFTGDHEVLNVLSVLIHGIPWEDAVEPEGPGDDGAAPRVARQARVATAGPAGPAGPAEPRSEEAPRPAAITVAGAAPRGDQRGDPRRRRGAWKGNGRAADRAG